jgi:hypothetical protein
MSTNFQEHPVIRQGVLFFGHGFPPLPDSISHLLPSTICHPNLGRFATTFNDRMTQRLRSGILEVLRGGQFAMPDEFEAKSGT